MCDSSVAISWAVPSQATQETKDLLHQFESGAAFVVPVLWNFEVANSLLWPLRRKLLTPTECEEARQIWNWPSAEACLSPHATRP